MLERRLYKANDCCKSLNTPLFYLGEGEEKSHVAPDAVCLKDLARLNTFPGAGNLNQDAVFVHA